MIGRTSVLVMLAWLSLLGSVRAQGVNGILFGTVTDESKAILPGVTATITSTALPGGPATMVTDQNGGYRFPGLAPGTYTLTLNLQGFSSYTEDLRVSVGGTVERNVALKVGAVSETITVSGESPVIDTRNVAVTATATREFMENVPTHRVLMTDFLQTLPGVAAATPGAYTEQISVMGSPSNATSYLHDGVVINHPVTGNTWQGGDIDSAEEIQTVALGASAEYAIAAGGVVNVVTKSGTNTLHADATGYWKPDSLQSEGIKNDCGCPLGKTGFNLGKMRDWSIHTGGPVVKDKLWFYSGFREFNFTYQQTGTYPPEQPTSYWNMMPNKLTWAPSNSLRVTQLLHLEWWGGYSSGPTRLVTAQASTHTIAHIHSYATEVNKTFGGSTILTLRSTGWWEPSQYAPPISGDLTTPNHTDEISGLVTAGVPEVLLSKIRRDTQSAKVERYVSGSRVKHSLRGGVQVEEGRNTQDRAYPSGVQYFDLGTKPDYAIFRAPSVQGAEFTTQGGWGEDQLTIGDRVTVSLGLRFDRMHAISPDRPAINDKLEETGATIKGLGSMFVWNVWAPRAGVNMKLTGDGKTVLRGTYGRAYRQILLNEFDILHPGIPAVTQANFDPASGGYTQIVSVVNSTTNLRIDPNLAAPFTDSYSLGVDRQLMPQVAFNVSYVYKRGQDGTGWKDIGGVYGTSTATLSDGRTLTVYPLLNSPSARVYLRTNRTEYVETYQGLLLSLSKRLAQRWGAQINYSQSVAKGLRGPTGSTVGTFGRDPNDLVNAIGRVATDRPSLFNANATYDIPRIEVRLSANYQNLSALPYAPNALISLPQGRRAINIEAPGFFRPERLSLLYFRVDKILLRQGSRRLELIANVTNALQSTAPGTTFFTFNYFSPLYGQPVTYVQPRQLYVGARYNF